MVSLFKVPQIIISELINPNYLHVKKKYILDLFLYYSLFCPDSRLLCLFLYLNTFSELFIVPGSVSQRMPLRNANRKILFGSWDLFHSATLSVL